MFFDIFTILPLTCAVFVAMFGVFVLFKDAKSRMNQLLFAFNVSMFFWLFGTFMMFATRGSVISALFWDRFVYLGVILMPPLMHQFSLVFSNNKSKAQKIILVFNYLISGFFLFASRTPYFVDSLYVYSWGAHSQARILHSVFLGYFFLGTGIFFVNLFRYYRASKERIVKIQTIYVFLAFALVMFVGGSAYLFAYGIDTKFPFAYITGLLFPIMLFYAVSKHHLLGTKMMAVEVLIGAAEFFVVMQVFYSTSVVEIFVRTIFAVLTALMGVLLVKSVEREVERRREVTELAHSLEKANLRLQELDQQKTEFLSIASHQLRTPLTVLKGYAELVADGAYGRPTAGIKKVMGEMDQSNEHLVKLIDEFLDISRIEQGRTKYVFVDADIVKIASGIVNELRTKAKKKNLKLILSVGGVKGKVCVDEEKIRHVIFNFVDNAIKYSDKGTVEVKLSSEDRGLNVRVVDQGLGFGKIDEANFFQKFYRGENVKKESVTGTGLGLYVCRKFVEVHGGRIWAKSEGAGKGSEFGFWIPNKRKSGTPGANSDNLSVSRGVDQ